MANPQSPGIYSSENPSEIVTIRSAPSDVGAFVGVTEKGPIGEPVLIDSIDKFRRIFGRAITTSYLYDALVGFFDNEGGVCWVVRTAHYTDITDPSTLTALRATSTLNTESVVAAVTLYAREGVYGNNYRVSSTRRELLIGGLTAPIALGVTVTSLSMAGADRLRIGDQIRLEEGASIERTVVIGVNGSEVIVQSFTTSAAFTIAAQVYSESFDLSFFEHGNLLRRYAGLQISPLAGPRFIENVVDYAEDPELMFDAAELALTPGPTVDPRPVDVTLQAFAGGSNGGAVVDTDYVGSSAGKTGLYALISVAGDFDCVAVPGQATAAVHTGLEVFTKTAVYGVMAIIAVPQGTATPTAAKTYIQTTANLSGDNIVPYWPWIKVIDPISGSKIVFPPEGHAMGAWFRTSKKRKLSKSPAGVIDGKLVGAVGLEYPTNKAEADVVYPANINTIQQKKGSGVCLYGSRTLGVAGGADLGQINKRRVQNSVIKSVDAGTQFIVFENNDTETRAKWKRSVETYLLGVWNGGKGDLDGDTAAEAFYVICDSSNNPPSLINQKKFRGKVGLRHKETIEFAEYEFEEDLRALIAEVSAI